MCQFASTSCNSYTDLGIWFPMYMWIMQASSVNKLSEHVYLHTNTQSACTCIAWVCKYQMHNINIYIIYISTFIFGEYRSAMIHYTQASKKACLLTIELPLCVMRPTTVAAVVMLLTFQSKPANHCRILTLARSQTPHIKGYRKKKSTPEIYGGFLK